MPQSCEANIMPLERCANSSISCLIEQVASHHGEQPRETTMVFSLTGCPTWKAEL
jgi:hypothetical protein